jgi:hypothetical protein
MQWKLDARMDEHGDDFTPFSLLNLHEHMFDEMREFSNGGFKIDEAVDVGNFAMFLAWLAMRRKKTLETEGE